MGKVDEVALREKREALERDQAALAATGKLRSDRDLKRATAAAEEASSSQAASSEAVSACFVSRPALGGGAVAGAGANEHVVRRIFHDEERLAVKSGRSGVAAAELAAVLEACTGCVPSAPECEAMMAGNKTIDVDMFLLIYRNIHAGVLPFANLSTAMAAFDALCAEIPDTIAVA